MGAKLRFAGGGVCVLAGRAPAPRRQTPPPRETEFRPQWRSQTEFGNEGLRPNLPIALGFVPGSAKVLGNVQHHIRTTVVPTQAMKRSSSDISANAAPGGSASVSHSDGSAHKRAREPKFRARAYAEGLNAIAPLWHSA